MIDFLRALRCVIVAAFAAAAPTAAAGENITFEDMLSAEDFEASFGASAFSPDGRTLVYTVTTGATARPTWGYFGATLQTMSRVYVTVDGAAPREVVGRDEEFYAPYLTNVWSPDSRGLMLVATRRDQFGLVYYDTASRRMTAFPGRPSLPFIGAFAWMPGGRIVYSTVASETPQQGSADQTLRMLTERWRATWEGRAPQVTVNSTSPVFAPTETAPGALMLADVRTGRASRIAEGDFVSAAASPAGDVLAAVVTAEASPNAIGVFGDRSELVLFKLERGGARLLSRESDLDVASDRLAWSPSGRTLLVVGRPRAAQSGESHLYAIDAESGARRSIVAEGLAFTRPSPENGAYPLAWLGETPVAIAVREVEGAPGAVLSNQVGGPSFEYGQARNTREDVYVFGPEGPQNLTAFARAAPRDFVVTQDGGVLVVLDGALWRVAPGVAAQRLTPEGGPAIAAFGVDRRLPTPDAQTAYYSEGDVERISLLSIGEGGLTRLNLDLKTGALAPIEAAGEILLLAPNRRTAVTRTVNGWSSAYAIDNGAPRDLVTLNARLRNKAVAPVERFAYTADSRELVGYVVWPPDARPDERLPAIVSVYGGTVYGAQPPRSTQPGGNPIFSGQLLAAEGYAVIYPSTPLPPGADGDQPAALAEAVIAAVDALAAGGRIDASRVGVMGQSFGGFSTAALLARRSDRFKAGVALSGLYDYFHGYGARGFVSMFSDDPITTMSAMSVELAQGQFGAPFWQAPEAYIRNSPIFGVDAMNAPLLMLHGDIDGLASTDLSGAERLYASFLRTGKPATLVHYWGEGHLAQSGVAMRDQWMRITRWFDHYLSEAP